MIERRFQKNKTRYYGKWSNGKPKGVPEDKKKCIVEMLPKDDFSRQCRNKRGHGPHGLYCRQHAKVIEDGRPVYVPPLEDEEKRKTEPEWESIKGIFHRMTIGRFFKVVVSALETKEGFDSTDGKWAAYINGVKIGKTFPSAEMAKKEVLRFLEKQLRSAARKVARTTKEEK